MVIRAIFFSFLLFNFPLVLTAQIAEDKIMAGIDSFALNRPQEKAYIQTDKQTYLSGETIWFKTYATLGEKLTILSKVIYVDMIDITGKVLQKQMLKLENGMADGAMDITKQLSSGDYYVRCYTLWMLNFPAFITQQKISVLNYNNIQKAKPVIPANAAIAINFYPEGGNMIVGLKSVIAFKALDENNNPLNITGIVQNSKNEKRASFVTAHNGMGSFELTMAAGESYKAIITANGNQQTIALPAAKEEGITINVDNTNTNKAFIKVERSEKNKTTYNNLTILAQCNYQVVYIGKLNIDEGQDAVAINKKNLPAGIMQVTVLTAEGKPLAERILFVGNHTINNELLQSINTSTEKRKKNILTLNAMDFNNLQAAISVTNADADVLKKPTSILSNFLLSSDIKGIIHEPAYYFKDKDPQTLQHLDLVMLVNGWRRFNLDELVSNKLPALYYPFETSMSISGKLLQGNGKSAVRSGRVNLIIQAEDSTKILSEATVNDASLFVVDHLEYKKDATIYYQGTNTGKENAIVTVKFNDAYYDTLKKATLNAITYEQSDEKLSEFNRKLIAQKQSNDISFGKTLESVTVKAKKVSVIDSLNNLYASPFFFESDQTITVDDNANAFDMLQLLQRMVPGLVVNKTDTGTQVNFGRYNGLNYFSSDVDNSSVQFFLNEVPVSAAIIDALNPTDVGVVKIYKGATAIALGADRGAIAIYTVKGKSTRDWRDKGFDYIKKAGYTVQKEFYAMDYAKINTESIPTDIRPTLFWNPSIKIIDGKADIQFYNDDAAKKFNIVIEGIDADGKLLHIEKIIQ